MWIPSPVYERTPQYWLFLGLFLIVTSTYLVLEMHRAYLFGGAIVGLACCAWSAMTLWRRSFNRENSQEQTTESPENA